jgi:uncharacterized protein (UPF0332 family)
MFSGKACGPEVDDAYANWCGTGWGKPKWRSWLHAWHTKIGHYGTVANRAYYAMFYSALALLAMKDKLPRRHSQALSEFDVVFVKNGTVEKSYSAALHEAFDLRQTSDYGLNFSISLDRAETLLTNAELFFRTAQEWLRAEG